MNILVIELDTVNSEISGVGQTVLNLSKAWLADNNHVSIIMPQNWSDSLLLKNSLKRGNILYVNQSPKNKNVINVSLVYFLRLLKGTAHIFKIIRDRDLDFIFVDSQISFIGAVIANCLNSLVHSKKAIVIMPFYHLTSHKASYQKTVVTYLQHISALISLTVANNLLKAYFFTESTFTAKILNKNYNIPIERVLPIGGGVDESFVDRIQQLSKEKLFDACFIGRIHSAKGIFDLIHAWSVVTSKLPNAKLSIIGGGYPNYRKILEDLICELHLENNVVFKGTISDEEKFLVLAQSKILVHPAYEECIPLTFFEAASVNLPIVTYYLPTYENVAECLIPVPKGDVAQLAKTLIDVISKYDANGEKAFLSLLEKERILVSKHTWKNIARSLLSVKSE